MATEPDAWDDLPDTFELDERGYAGNAMPIVTRVSDDQTITYISTSPDYERAVRQARRRAEQPK